MKERLKAVLLLLGVSAEHADKLLESDEAPKDLTNEQVKAAAVEKLKKVLEADKSFTDPIHKATQGKLLDMWTKKVRKAFPGITDEEFDALPQENNFEALVTLAATKATAEKGDAGDKDKEITKLNGTLRELRTELKKIREEELPAAKAAGERERENVLLDREAERVLTKGEGLVIDAEFAIPSAMSKLREQYDVKHLNGKPVLRKKGEDVAAFDAENNEVTFEAALRAIGTTAKLFKVSNGTADVKKGGDGDGDDGAKGRNINLPPGVAKAKAHADKMKEAAGAKG